MAAEIIKLQHIQLKYEKELQPIMLCVNNLEERNVCSKEIDNSHDENSAHEEIKEVAQLMRNIRLTLLSGNSNNDTIVDIDPKEIKERMIAMQEIILDIRKREHYVLRKLKSQEEFLTFDNREILYDDKLTQWSVPINFEKHFGKKTIKRNHSCKEVNDFFEFLTKSGGSTNGWSQDDHNIFLKTRSFVKSKKKLIALLRNKLMNKTENEVGEHIHWYSKYLQLKQKKLDALKIWKSERKLDNVASPISESTSSTEMKNSKLFDQEGRKKIKEKLSKWKQERHEKKLHVVKVDQTQRQRLCLRESQKKKERKLIKKDVSNWQLAKTYNEQLEREQKELLTKLDKKYREREANKKIKTFQSKDDTYLQKKLFIKQRCRSVEVHKERQSAKTVAPRDPNRLFKPTKQWLNRQSTVTSNDTANNLLYINNVSRLAIPDWRKSLG